MTLALVPLAHDATLTRTASPLHAAGEAANAAASRHLFADYRTRKAANTVRRQDDALALFARFLVTVGIPAAPMAAELGTDPAAWAGISWGMAKAFTSWLLGQGYALGTVNVHLSTLKAYAKLAMQAGTISESEYVAIRAVSGYGHAEGQRYDTQRAEAGTATRTGTKKADPVALSKEQATRLRRQPDTPQGRRDRLMLCLLLDHGLRVGELAGLTITALDLAAGTLTFYRQKVDRTQTHKLTAATLKAARAYMATDAAALGPLLRASRKGGELTTAGMSTRAICERVGVLGAAVGLAGLSPHDLRHAWATSAARNGTPIDRLQDAGGWSSPAMPLRYIENARIANEGVRLDPEED